MTSARALVRAMRPHQWTKNLFVFAPLLFARSWDTVPRVLAAFGAFCLVASAIYLLNDSLDREQDRLHPVKRNRPIASGALGVPTALGVAVVLAVVALAWAWGGLESPGLTLVLAVYLVIQALYSLRLKHMVVLDVLCIASGFVLRLLAGGFAGGVPQSEWIVICTIFLSLFLALCKRRHEVSALGEQAEEHREILGQYPISLLDQLISAATAATLVTYALYTVDDRTVSAHGLDRDGLSLMVATVPFVIYGVFRYLYLVHRREGGGSPTTTLARDGASVVNGLLFLATALLILSRGSV